MMIFATAVLAISTPLAARDPVKNVPVQFAKGISSKTFKGSVRGYATVNYTVNARAGQTMRVRLTTSNSSSYFNVTASGADTAMFNGSMSGSHFSATAPSSGSYTIQVYLMRNAARRNEVASYTLNFAIL